MCSFAGKPWPRHSSSCAQVKRGVPQRTSITKRRPGHSLCFLSQALLALASSFYCQLDPNQIVFHLFVNPLQPAFLPTFWRNYPRPLGCRLPRTTNVPYHNEIPPVCWHFPLLSWRPTSSTSLFVNSASLCVRFHHIILITILILLERQIDS